MARLSCTRRPGRSWTCCLFKLHARPEPRYGRGPHFAGLSGRAYREIISLAPDLSKRLSSARQVSPFKGTSKLPNFYRLSFGRGWALVGDAAYHRAGMGIGDAFLGADLLANAVAEGLTGNDAHLDAMLAASQNAFRQKTMPVFEYTVRAAGLKEEPITPLCVRYGGERDPSKVPLGTVKGSTGLEYFAASFDHDLPGTLSWQIGNAVGARYWI
jgi:hypothetical protein